MDGNNCNDYEPFLTATTFHILLLVHCIFAVLTIVSNLIFLFNHVLTLYFHKNIKTIISASLIANVMHASFILFVQGTHLYLMVTAESPCDILLSVVTCLAGRGPITILQLTFFTLNTVIVVERVVATYWRSSYEAKKQRLGPILVAVAVISSCILTFDALRPTPLTGFSPYCSAVNEYTEDNITRISYMLTGMELTAIVVFFFNYGVNNVHNRKRAYCMRSDYQARENLNATQLMLPWMVYHLLTFAVFYLFSALVPMYWKEDPMDRAVAYSASYQMVHFYTFSTPIVLWLIVRNQRQHRKNALVKLSTAKASRDEVYQYLKMWN